MRSNEILKSNCWVCDGTRVLVCACKRVCQHQSACLSVQGDVTAPECLSGVFVQGSVIASEFCLSVQGPGLNSQPIK